MKKVVKKIICLAAAAGILTASASAAFVDMPSDDTAKAALEKAVENGLLNGVGDDRIAPYETITRSQMGAIIVRAMNAVKTADISRYTDVSKTEWYYDEMSRAVYMGAFEGNEYNMLSPNSPITFQEAFLVLSRVFDLRYIDDNCLDKFADKDTVASWAEEGVKKIVSGGYYDGDLIKAEEPMSRLDFAMVMSKLVPNYIDSPGTYNSLPDGNVLIRCSGVVMDGVKSDDLIIIGDGVESTSLLNADADNVVLRGGDLKLSGLFGVVRAVMDGTSLSPDTENTNVKTYADGSRGVIAAVAEGSVINIEQIVD